MNHIAEEIYSILNGEELYHYGMPRRSGRYPYGSGKDPYQHFSNDFISRVEKLKKEGWTETPENIKKEFGINTTQYRNEIAYAKYERRLYQVETAKSLKSDGLGATEIGKKMNLPESTVRSLLNDKAESRMNQARNTADFLKDVCDKKGMIDVGTGVERELKVSKEKLKLALFMLEKEGYEVYSGGIPQVTNPGKQTTQTVLCPPGTPHKDIYKYDQIHTINEYTSQDGGDTFHTIQYPKSLDSSRLKVRYAEEGGLEKDGIIELRRGVEDISLGDDRYSQVRILVDNERYLKGMAVYSDNMPDGVDVIFNTNKTKDTPKMETLKKIKDDPDNPFGSLIKSQRHYIDENGNEQLSVINKRAEQGDWTEWKDALPSQFLGKQSQNMIKKQLNLAKADKLAEYEEICSINNPTIKKYFLQEFSDNCDAAAVHLQAAALPGQKYHVIIPVNSLRDNEIYAPQYESGTKLALIRYPHGGTFEIPILTVNNKHQGAKKLIGADSIDAVGINKNIADRLSGADFDGDTVMCIPTHDRAGKVKVTSTDPLKGLEGFDPKLEYPKRPGMKLMKNTGTQMGIISNLITDMTLQGATPDELARAVRHSMVVIDAEKHELDYKRSEVENNIAALKQRYQRKVDPDGTVHTGGASTILSRSKGETSVIKREGTPKINIKGTKDYDPSKPEGAYLYKNAKPEKLYKPEYTTNKKTGVRTYTTVDGQKIKFNPNDKEAKDKYIPIKKVDPDTGDVRYFNKDGSIEYKIEPKTQKSTRMMETDDAYSLVSDMKHPKEILYAEYANSMKSLANQARKEMVTTPGLKYSKEAKETYSEEVKSLMDKLDTALLNAGRERAAQRMSNHIIEQKKKANPNMKTEDIKKASQQAIAANRAAVGSIKRRDREIEITDREWEAIQAGAISENKLKQILANSNADTLRERATPRTRTTISTVKMNQIRAMSASNYTLQEIAKRVGLSPSAVSQYLKGVK